MSFGHEPSAFGEPVRIVAIAGGRDADTPKVMRDLAAAIVERGARVVEASVESLRGDTVDARLASLRELDTDLVLLDCGFLGLRERVDFFVRAERRILVVAPLLDSVRDVHASIAAALDRGIDPFKLGSLLFGHRFVDAKDDNLLYGLSRMFRTALSIPAPIRRTVGALADGVIPAEITEMRRVPNGIRSNEPKPNLPVTLERYLRRDDRVSVDWLATVKVDEGAQPVKLVDISKGGAGLRSPSPLKVGEEVVVVLDGHPDAPALTAIVRNVDPLHARVGIEFVGEFARAHAEQLVEHVAGEGTGERKAGDGG